MVPRERNEAYIIYILIYTLFYCNRPETQADPNRYSALIRLLILYTCTVDYRYRTVRWSFGHRDDLMAGRNPDYFGPLASGARAEEQGTGQGRATATGQGTSTGHPTRYGFTAPSDRSSLLLIHDHLIAPRRARV